MTMGTRKDGEFCFFNMITADPDQARAFYGALFGWTYTDVPQAGGHMVVVGGHMIGGLWNLHHPQTPPGTRAHIGVSIKVKSADESAARALSNGGTHKPAFDVFDAGRMAVVNDPTGAQLDVWQPKSHHGTDVDSGTHGAVAWHELSTNDGKRAAAFYSEVFGWSTEKMPADGSEYIVCSLGGDRVAGIMSGMPLGDAGAAWKVYFSADDVDATVKKAGELGAKICQPPTDIPNVGRFAILESPQGIDFRILKLNPRQ